MPLPLFKFPLLVQDLIMNEMETAEIFILSLLSKRAQKLIKRCVCWEALHIHIDKNPRINFDTCTGLEVSIFTLYFCDATEGRNANEVVLHRLELTGFSYYEVVPAELTKEGVYLYFGNEREAFSPIIKHLAEMISNFRVKLYFDEPDFDIFSNIIRLFKELDAGFELIDVECRPSGTNDEIMQEALDQCCSTARLVMYVYTSPEFEYDFTTHAPFTFHYVSIAFGHWITKDHLIKHFMECKKVHMRFNQYNDEELIEIFQFWIDGSPLEELELCYSGKSLAEVFEKIEGPTPVYYAKIVDSDGTSKFRTKFKEGRCYLIEQRGGKKAIVYKFYDVLTLITDYELKKDEDDEADYEYLYDDDTDESDEEEEEEAEDEEEADSGDEEEQEEDVETDYEEEASDEEEEEES